MKSYDYQYRRGVRALSWDDFATMTAQLTEKLAAQKIQAVVGIARAGLFPATAVACSLRTELYPARVTRRLNDLVTYPEPVWRTPVSPDVSGKTIAVIDEIADTGQTLALVVSEAIRLGATRVISACLASHTWASPAPDITALVSDELIIFPWDRQVFVDGRWQPHPEIVSAIKAQQPQEPEDSDNGQ